jgi:hypothetical protein
LIKQSAYPPCVTTLFPALVLDFMTWAAQELNVFLPLTPERPVVQMVQVERAAFFATPLALLSAPLDDLAFQFRPVGALDMSRVAVCPWFTFHALLQRTSG